jgi:hypothetical protein
MTINELGTRKVQGTKGTSHAKYVTLPKVYLDACGIEPGTPMKVTTNGVSITYTPEKKTKTRK